MRAWVLKKCEGIKGFEMEDLPIPAIQKGFARVRILASALNHRDLWISIGRYAQIRLPVILGSDGAGVVEEVGSPRDKKWIGKDVVILPSLFWGRKEKVQGERFQILGMPTDGTFAEYTVVPVENLFPKPSYLSWEESAAFPLAGLTAYRALFTRGKVLRDEKVLITGIGGGVATFALLFACAVGAEVYVTSGDEKKLKKAVDLGARGGVNYRSSDWIQKLKDLLPGGFDCIVDGTGGDLFPSLISLCAPGGRIVLYGATAGLPRGEIDLRRIFYRQITLCGSTMGSPREFRTLLRFLEEHKIHPIIDKVFPFEEFPRALERMEKGEQMGKIVLSVR
jgi:NADPH:quinone reductase-like Zn-dependent oxidoreductase